MPPGHVMVRSRPLWAVTAAWILFQTTTVLLLSSWLLAIINIAGFGLTAALLWAIIERLEDEHRRGG